jgi:hypothetical protein
MIIEKKITEQMITERMGFKINDEKYYWREE